MGVDIKFKKPLDSPNKGWGGDRYRTKQYAIRKCEEEKTIESTAL